MHAPDNAAQDAARLRKAVRLANWLDAQGIEPDGVAALAVMPTEWWEQIARHAGTRAPSAQTVELVVAELIERHRIAELAAANRSDALAGLPKASDRPVHFRGCSA